MKTLRSIMLGLALLLVCSATKASNIKGEKLTRNHALYTYADAITQGKLSNLNDVLDKTAEFSMLRGKTIISFSRKQMLDYLKSNKNVEEICTTSTSIIASDANVEIVKFDMKFKGFVRHNYITIANTGNGWKITNVYSTFS
jgi:hypothetical protein